MNHSTPLSPQILHRRLQELDRLWAQPHGELLNQEMEQWLAEALTLLIDKSLNQIRRHRDIFPALHQPSKHRLEYMLRYMNHLTTARAHRQVCPFNKALRGEMVAALRRGSVQWAQHQLRESQKSPNALVGFTATLIANLRLGLDCYHSIFDSTNGIQYFSVVYKQFDIVVSSRRKTILNCFI